MMTYVVIGATIVVVILLCLCLAIASFSFDNYKEKLQENSLRKNSHDITTLDYVQAISDECFNGQLKIVRCDEFQDHYSSGKIALSQSTMFSNNLASLSIVSHELGHARQDCEGNKLKRHWKLRLIGKMCGYAFMPSVIVGVILSILNIFEVLSQLYILIIGLSLVGLGILIFLFAIYLKYREIQIEKEATKYALEFLKMILTEEEIKCATEFLDSARLTYWASLFRTMLGWTFLTKKENMFR